MTTEADFAAQQQVPNRLLAWAENKFGQLVGQYKPSTQELARIEAYYKQHPGAPAEEFVTLLAAQRQGQLHQGPMPVAPGTPGVAGVLASPTTPTTDATGTPVVQSTAGPAPAAKPAAPAGSLSAQIAAALKGQQSTTSAVLDNFAGTTPVWVDQPPTGFGQSSPDTVRDPLRRIAPSGPAAITSTYQDVLTEMYKMDAASLKALKQQLWAGGFYPAGTDKSVVDSATPDVKTRNAYLIAVQQAARLAEAGKQTTVSQVIAMGNPDPAKAVGASAYGPYTITNPADLKSALNSAAQTMLGQDLTEADIKKFSALYQGMEAQSSIRAQAAGANNQTIGIVAPPTTSAAAQDYIQTHLANQADAYGAVSRQQAFYGMLGAI